MSARRGVAQASHKATLIFGADELWRDQALCAQTDPEVFFPEKGRTTRDAKLICSRCPVTTACLESAVGNGERFGVWGGHSERERRDLRIAPQRELFTTP